MRKRRGVLHATVRFFDRVLSATPPASEKALAAYRVASRLLKELDEIQSENSLVTLSIATDSLRVYFSGRLHFHVQPRKLRTIIWIPGGLDRALANGFSEQTDLFPVEGEHISWVVSNEKAVDWLATYIREEWRSPNNDFADLPSTHSRHIPGEVRQAALTDFLATGSWCPGVSGVQKRHKVVDGQRIEFDHILPHALGGSNGYQNVQVLCAECNRLKGASAA